MMCVHNWRCVLLHAQMESGYSYACACGCVCMCVCVRMSKYSTLFAESNACLLMNSVVNLWFVLIAV